jgi:thioredoxin reductase (NADPH)
MPKPVILTVDDDPEVLRAIERDLRRRYGAEYRILRADSGESALEATLQLRERGDAVALFLVDQRMPHMSGVGFLAQAMEHYPDARRVLLTAYADTEAAIRAINEVQINHYLLKPWDPPEERLYPVLSDLLEDWQSGYRPPFEGIRVLGLRWSPKSHQVKDFLGRNQIPYQWLDVEASAEARALLETAESGKCRLPLVLFPDGSRLVEPTNRELADRVGLSTRPEQPFYDFVIVGGGPAGLAAAVYGASEGLRTVLIEREAPGGQAGTSSRIENYLGFPSGLSGADLTRRAVAQARRFGVEILSPQEVRSIRVEDPYRIVQLDDGTEVAGQALLLASGVSYRKLEVPGCARLAGAGVYYGAAMTEAIACRNEDVYIVGAANSAGQAAMYFARFARRVVMLVRGESLTASMSQYLIEQIAGTPNIEVQPHTQVLDAGGDGNLECLTIYNSKTGEKQVVPAASLFIFIGAQPHTDYAAGVLERDERGFILAGRDLMPDGKRPAGWKPDRDPYLLETSVPGIFVAGDVRHGSVKRVASGVGEGSIAVQFVHQYLATV